MTLTTWVERVELDSRIVFEKRRIVYWRRRKILDDPEMKTDRKIFRMLPWPGNSLAFSNFVMKPICLFRVVGNSTELALEQLYGHILQVAKDFLFNEDIGSKRK